MSPKTVWRHLVITLDDAEGVGELTLDPSPPGLAEEAVHFATELVGSPIDDGLVARFAALRDRDLAGAAIVSALDQALHDLAARRSGRTLAEALGGSSAATVGLYANINRRTLDRSPAGFAASASDAVRKGFDTIKIAPFDGLRPDLCSTREGNRLAGMGLERIAALRDCLPRNVAIQVDCHWRLDRATALAMLPELAALDVSWFECPVPETSEHIADLVAIRARANARGIRLAGCETMTLWAGFRPFVEAGAYDVVMPDVKYVGGYGALREVTERARASGVAVSLHNPTGPICHLHSLHACAALDLTERLEMQFEESPLFQAIVSPGLPEIENGRSALPDGPGIGASLRADVASARPEEARAMS